jgi:hypothetical protein
MAKMKDIDGMPVGGLDGKKMGELDGKPKPPRTVEHMVMCANGHSVSVIHVRGEDPIEGYICHMCGAGPRRSVQTT